MCAQSRIFRDFGAVKTPAESAFTASVSEAHSTVTCPTLFNDKKVQLKSLKSQIFRAMQRDHLPSPSPSGCGAFALEGDLRSVVRGLRTRALKVA